MTEKDVKSFSGVIFFESDHNFVHKVNVGFKGYLEVVAICKGNGFPDGFEDMLIFLSYNRLGIES